MVSYLVKKKPVMVLAISLNPYCSGQWTRTHARQKRNASARKVLILIVVDNGLVQIMKSFETVSAELS